MRTRYVLQPHSGVVNPPVSDRLRFPAYECAAGARPMFVARRRAHGDVLQSIPVYARCTFLAAALALLPAASVAGVEIESRVTEGAWQRAAAVDARAGAIVSLRVRLPRGASIRWYRIVPDVSKPYNNAVWPWDPNPYRWLGYARIRYAREEIDGFRGQSEIVLTPASRTWRQAFGRGDGASAGMGSFWFQAEVESGGRVFASPGLERNDQRGLSPEILRVTFRAGDDLLGHLTGFFNVPGVFGAVPYQVANYIGVDCADVLMAAHARASGRPIVADHNVAGLTRALPAVRSTRIHAGTPTTPLRWGTDVLPGDLIAVKYNGWGQFGHIGALYADRNRNGLLDDADLVLHAGPMPLRFSTLGEGAFDGQAKILRPRSRH